MNNCRVEWHTLIILNKRCLILLCLSVFILLISACSKTDSSQIVDDNPAARVSIPSFVAVTILPADGSKTAAIYIDENTTPANQQVLDANATEVSFQLTVPAGEHTFKIVFQYNDQTWGLFELASAASIPITIEAGSVQSLSFEEQDYLPLPDDDGDGLTNLAELEAGTDPGNPDTDAPSTTATPVGGSYTTAQSVELTCDDGLGGSGCNTNFYSFDPVATPDQFLEYTSNIGVADNATLRFFSMDNAGNKGSVLEERYIIDSNAPVTTASPPGDTYIGSQQVKLICNDGVGAGCAATYFSTDGSVPTIDPANLYTQPISITGNTILRFLSVDNLGNQEGVVRQDYFISGFTKTVAAGNITTGTGPFNTDSYNHQQILYRVEEIKGTGYIHSIKLRYDAEVASNVTCPNTTIKIGQTNVTDITDRFSNNVEQGQGSLATVFNGSLVLEPGSAGEYKEIVLSSPFNYNGVDNLIIDVERTAACDASVDLRYENIGNYISLLTSNTPASAVGTTSLSLAHTKFVFSGGDDNIVYEGTLLSNGIPFSNNPLSKVQQLYSADEIDGAGVINGIGFRINAETTTEQNYVVTVKLGHSQLNDLTATFATNYSDIPVTVANSVYFEVPAGMPVGSYIWVPFIENSAFEYNGIDNLIVELEVTSPVGTTFISYVELANNVRVYGASGATTGTVNNFGYVVKLRFAGGPLNIVADQGVGLTYSVTTFPTRTQFLYRAAELGTSGTIDRIRLRLYTDSIPTDYASFQIIVGHSTASQLAASFSGNMIDASTVTVGTFPMPAGVLSGDWIDLVFLNPFIYDGVRNLVIDLSSAGGAAVNSYRSVVPTTGLFTNRHITAPDNTTDTATVFNDNVADIQIVFQ